MALQLVTLARCATWAVSRQFLNVARQVTSATSSSSSTPASSAQGWVVYYGSRGLASKSTQQKNPTKTSVGLKDNTKDSKKSSIQHSKPTTERSEKVASKRKSIKESKEQLGNPKVQKLPPKVQKSTGNTKSKPQSKTELGALNKKRSLPNVVNASHNADKGKIVNGGTRRGDALSKYNINNTKQTSNTTGVKQSRAGNKILDSQSAKPNTASSRAKSKVHQVPTPTTVIGGSKYQSRLATKTQSSPIIHSKPSKPLSNRRTPPASLNAVKHKKAPKENPQKSRVQGVHAAAVSTMNPSPAGHGVNKEKTGSDSGNNPASQLAKDMEEWLNYLRQSVSNTMKRDAALVKNAVPVSKPIGAAMSGVRKEDIKGDPNKSVGYAKRRDEDIQAKISPPIKTKYGPLDEVREKMLEIRPFYVEKVPETPNDILLRELKGSLTNRRTNEDPVSVTGHLRNAGFILLNEKDEEIPFSGIQSYKENIDSINNSQQQKPTLKESPKSSFVLLDDDGSSLPRMDASPKDPSLEVFEQYHPERSSVGKNFILVNESNTSPETLPMQENLRTTDGVNLVSPKHYNMNETTNTQTFSQCSPAKRNSAAPESRPKIWDNDTNIATEGITNSKVVNTMNANTINSDTKSAAAHDLITSSTGPTLCVKPEEIRSSVNANTPCSYIVSRDGNMIENSAMTITRDREMVENIAMKVTTDGEMVENSAIKVTTDGKMVENSAIKVTTDGEIVDNNAMKMAESDLLSQPNRPDTGDVELWSVILTDKMKEVSSPVKSVEGNQNASVNSNKFSEMQLSSAMRQMSPTPLRKDVYEMSTPALPQTIPDQLPNSVKKVSREQTKKAKRKRNPQLIKELQAKWSSAFREKFLQMQNDKLWKANLARGQAVAASTLKMDNFRSKITRKMTNYQSAKRVSNTLSSKKAKEKVSKSSSKRPLPRYATRSEISAMIAGNDSSERSTAVKINDERKTKNENPTLDDRDIQKDTEEWISDRDNKYLKEFMQERTAFEPPYIWSPKNVTSQKPMCQVNNTNVDELLSELKYKKKIDQLVKEAQQKRKAKFEDRSSVKKCCQLGNGDACDGMTYLNKPSTRSRYNDISGNNKSVKDPSTHALSDFYTSKAQQTSEILGSAQNEGEDLLKKVNRIIAKLDSDAPRVHPSCENLSKSGKFKKPLDGMATMTLKPVSVKQDTVTPGLENSCAEVPRDMDNLSAVLGVNPSSRVYSNSHHVSSEPKLSFPGKDTFRSGSDLRLALESQRQSAVNAARKDLINTYKKNIRKHEMALQRYKGKLKKAENNQSFFTDQSRQRSDVKVDN